MEKWFYMLVEKDTMTGIIGGFPMNATRSIEKEELVVCSNPKKNFPYPRAKITHPLEMLWYLREHHRERIGGMEHDIKSLSEYSIVFWSEIPKKVALKFKETYE